MRRLGATKERASGGEGTRVRLSWSHLAQHFSWICGFFLAATTIAGCAPVQQRPPAPKADARSTSPNGFLEGSAGRIRSHVLDFPLELTLPGKASWELAEGPTWLVLEHRPSSSQLALRTWRAERLVRRNECEAQARLARPTIPIEHEEAVVDRHALSAPADFDSELVVGVEPSALGIAGYALVIGASVGRCYAAVFTTRVSGKDAELEVAARLGLVVDRVLSQVRIRSVDERAPRRHLVATPKAPRK
jgi:hypothetical protein